MTDKGNLQINVCWQNFHAWLAMIEFGVESRSQKQATVVNYLGEVEMYSEIDMLSMWAIGSLFSHFVRAIEKMVVSEPGVPENSE